MRIERRVIDNHQANLVSYMAEGWSAPTFVDHQFLGFFPVADGWKWGVDFDGENHVAVHMFQTKPGFFWGDDPKETAELVKDKPWVLMFYGSDNTSYFQRFPDIEKLNEFWMSRSDVDPERDGLLSYNS